MGAQRTKELEPQTFPPQHQDLQPGLESQIHPKPESGKCVHLGSGKLEGMVALITGGDGGIGRAVAVLFSREGADVAAVYLNEHDDAKETKRLVEKEGRQCLLVAGDKGAIMAFTRSLSQALAEKNIRVNGVAPGPIWTPLIPSTFDEEHVAKFGADTPMRRAGQPEEVAPCFVFLASDDSSYITGQILHPNGGGIVGG